MFQNDQTFFGLPSQCASVLEIMKFGRKAGATLSLLSHAAPKNSQIKGAMVYNMYMKIFSGVF